MWQEKEAKYAEMDATVETANNISTSEEDDVPQGDVVQFGFRQSVSHERYAVHAVTGYIFNADVA